MLQVLALRRVNWFAKAFFDIKLAVLRFLVVGRAVVAEVDGAGSYVKHLVGNIQRFELSGERIAISIMVKNMASRRGMSSFHHSGRLCASSRYSSAVRSEKGISKS